MLIIFVLFPVQRRKTPSLRNREYRIIFFVRLVEVKVKQAGKIPLRFVRAGSLLSQ
jgi:hypothetical protein